MESNGSLKQALLKAGFMCDRGGKFRAFHLAEHPELLENYSQQLLDLTSET